MDKGHSLKVIPFLALALAQTMTPLQWGCDAHYRVMGQLKLEGGRSLQGTRDVSIWKWWPHPLLEPTEAPWRAHPPFPTLHQDPTSM